jgi:hypothetical protein
MPFNRCGKFLSNLVNGGNNSGELGDEEERQRASRIAQAVGGGLIAAAVIGSYVAPFIV